MADITAALRDDHAHCDEFFAAAENAAQGKRWEECAAQFSRFAAAINAHFSAEESVLFPAFEQATGMTGGPTQMMRMEHEQMRGLFDQMAQAVAGRDPGGFLGAADTLLILMQQHNFKEENILYPMCEQALSDEGADIGERLAAHLEHA